MSEVMIFAHEKFYLLLDQYIVPLPSLLESRRAEQYPENLAFCDTQE